MVRVEIKVWIGMFNPFPHKMRVQLDNLNYKEAIDKFLEGLNGNMFCVTEANGKTKMFNRTDIRRIKVRMLEKI